MRSLDAAELNVELSKLKISTAQQGAGCSDNGAAIDYTSGLLSVISSMFQVSLTPWLIETCNSKHLGSLYSLRL